MACGPAAEVREFIETNPASDGAMFTLVDFNDETLEHTNSTLNAAKAAHRRKVEIETINKTVHQILKEAARPSPASGQYDMVYCAGLFDYFSDRVCQRLIDYFYDLLAPGGLLIATNLDKSNPDRNGMEYLLEWHLFYRDKKQLNALRPDRAPPESQTVQSDETGVNIVIEVRKPEGD